MNLTLHKGKTIILGLDGFPYNLAMRLVEEGIMKNLSCLFDIVSPLRICAPFPDLSPVVWTTIFSGKDPGDHGIFGFTILDPASYTLRYTSSLDVRVPRLWEIATRDMLRSIVINVPLTYPATPINGLMTAGFVCPDLEKGTYPREFYVLLKEMGYLPEIDIEEAKISIDELFNMLRATLDKRMELLRRLIFNEEWNILVFVLSETDRLHHFMWEAIWDESHPLHYSSMSFYSLLDKYIGEIYEYYERLPDEKGEKRFFIVSDHGFELRKKEVYLNNYLVIKGFMQLRTPSRPSYEAILPDTMAIAMEPGRIYLNLFGRYARGSLYKGSTEGIIDDLIALFNDMIDPNPPGGISGKVIEKIYRKEEIYSGPYMDDAPELILIPAKGYDLKGGFSDTIFKDSLFTGRHRYDQMLFWSDRAVSSITNAREIMSVFTG